jgi:hypothetical protein
MTTLVIVALAFVGLTAISPSIQQAQAATTPLCGPATIASVRPETATTVTYGGKKFDIIGYNKDGVEVGVSGPNNSVTLLLNKAEVYDVQWSSVSANTYQGSTISSAMDTYANSTLASNDGIIDRTLTGGSPNNNLPGYNEDYIKGDSVDNQKVWPLSVDEATHLIVSNRAIFSRDLWLRNPGLNDDRAAGISFSGQISLYGSWSDNNKGFRPALYLNISNSVFSGLIFDNNNLSIGACTREPTNIGINFIAETITGLDTATEGWKIGPTYGGLGVFTAQASTSTDIDGIITNSTQSLVFVKASDDDDHFDSDKDRNNQSQESLATTINIPARPDAPTSPKGGAGKITGVTNSMQYSKDEVSWTAIGGSTISGLTSGTYFVRTIADQSTSKFKSFATEVVVKEGSSPSSGPGSRPSVGDGGDLTAGTAQTGIDFAGLELLLLLLLLLVIPASTCCAVLRCSEGSAGIQSR